MLEHLVTLSWLILCAFLIKKWVKFMQNNNKLEKDKNFNNYIFVWIIFLFGISFWNWYNLVDDTKNLLKAYKLPEVRLIEYIKNSEVIKNNIDLSKIKLK